MILTMTCGHPKVYMRSVCTVTVRVTVRVTVGVMPNEPVRRRGRARKCAPDARHMLVCKLEASSMTSWKCICHAPSSGTLRREALPLSHSLLSLRVSSFA